MSPQTVDGMHCTMCERGKKAHIQSHSHPLPMPPETQQEVSALLVECLSLSTESCLEPQGNSAATTLFLQLRKHAKLLKEVGRLGSVPLEPISGAPTVLKGGSFWGGQNVSPSPFYTPLLFGTELPKADGCADSLQIRADLRSSQRANQKQLSSAGVREGLCCPLLAPQESAEGIYFIRFIFTHYFFGPIREGRRRTVRAQVQMRDRDIGQDPNYGSMADIGSEVTTKLYCFGIWPPNHDMTGTELHLSYFKSIMVGSWQRFG